MSSHSLQIPPAEELISTILQVRECLRMADPEDVGAPRDFPIPEPPKAPPLVSVEVLVYNQASTLRQCIESIVAQKTDFPFEIIIGNDCSTDDSLDVALALQREHPDKIRILSTRRNVGLNRNARNVRRAMRATYQREMDNLESGLPTLASIGSVSPYIGLFGTVWGIMNAFTGLSALDNASLATVAPGIAEALVATAIGLFAAIPAVAAYNRFANDVERLSNRYESFAEEFQNILQRQRG